MGIIKNEIPILEFDTEQQAVLNPTHDDLKLNLPRKCVFAFLGNYIEEYAKLFRRAAAVPLRVLMNAHSLYRAKRCAAKAHPIIMHRLHVL